MSQKRPPRDPDWPAIKTWFETDVRGIDSCAKANGSTAATILKRAEKLGWVRCPEATQSRGRTPIHKPGAPVLVDEHGNTLPPLTDYEARFVDELMIDNNATKAIQRAGFVPQADATSDFDTLSSNAATKMKARANVAAHIAYRLAVLSRRCGIDAERVKRELATVAFVDPIAFYKRDPKRGNALVFRSLDEIAPEDRRCISEVQITTDRDGNQTVKLKLHSKVPALEKLGQTLDLFRQTHVLKDERDEGVDIGNPVADRIRQIRDARAAAAGNGAAAGGGAPGAQGGAAVSPNPGGKTVH